MASTFSKLHYHLVFSTKRRERIIDPEWEPTLHAYLGGCLRATDCFPLEIGGDLEHVHILTGMKPTHKVCDVVGDIKSGSSRWIHETTRLTSFEWQVGYAALTASARDLTELRGYIRNQKEHHRVTSFLDEYIAMLEEAGIEWDPKYLP
jgi:REP element-mobilizing transposase RayT